MNTKTITLTGAEVAVTGLDGAHAAIRNDGADTIYAAKRPGFTPGADGVLSVPAGGSVVLHSIAGTVYLFGTGSALIITSDYTDNPFKTSAQGGSGADEIARAAINAHTGNAEIHVTADEKTNWDAKANLSDIPTSLPANGGNADTVDGLHAHEIASNPNLLINPDFKVNQYGFTSVTARTGAKFFIDRWYVTRAAVALTYNGITLAWNGVDSSNGWIQQQIENDSLFGKAVALSGNIDGTRYYTITEIPADANISNRIQIIDKIYFVVGNVNNKTISFSVISNSTVPTEIGEFKLEIGNIATPFISPSPATELAKCQRYYQIRSTGDIAAVDLRPSMAEIKDIRQREDGNYEYIAEL